MDDRILTCAQCKKQFEGSRFQLRKARAGNGTYQPCCSPSCVSSFRAAKARKPEAAYQLDCSYCKKPFRASSYQVSKFRVSGGTKKVCCSPECHKQHRSAVAKQMHEKGLLVWGSPAQIEQARRLGASTPKGENAHNWAGGKHTAVMKAAMRERGAALRLLRESVRPTCARCNKDFRASAAQRHRWNRNKEATFFCPECCAHPSYHLYRVKAIRNPEDETIYYSDATCTGCGVVFEPNPGQRHYRITKRDADLYCTNECRKAHIPKGPVSPSWRHGGYTVVMKHTHALRMQIKQIVNEGANLPKRRRSSPEETEAKRLARKETEAKVISMVETHTLRQIAEAVGLTAPSVRYILDRANVAYPDKRRLRPDAPTEFEVACGVCSQPVMVNKHTYSHMKKHGSSTSCSPECLSEIRRRAGQSVPHKIKSGPENLNWKHGETSAEAVEKVKAYLKDNRTATISDVREALGGCSHDAIYLARKELDIQAPKMKHGLYTNNVHEVRGLIRQIKKLVREGAKA